MIDYPLDAESWLLSPWPVFAVRSIAIDEPARRLGRPPLPRSAEVDHDDGYRGLEFG